MKNQNITLTSIILTLGCLAFLPQIQAVSPTPDGCYPNFTTAEGCKALQSLTIGAANTAVGWSSLFTNTDGSFNTATGAGTLLFNTADANTAFGAAALLFNTIGENNTAIGAAALLNNTEGFNNTATGDSALENNTTGSNNTANGFGALVSNTSGSFNTAVGFQALMTNSGGNGNTASGAHALQDNTEGDFNTAVGDGALLNNTTGNGNIAVGLDAGSSVTTAGSVICIGASGANVSGCYIGHIFGAVSSGGAGVFVNSDGRLGTTTSSRRFKEEIKPMDKSSEAVLALKPVTFRYKKDIDPQGLPQFGLVAEDVEEVNPDLVVRDKEGKVNTVRYEAVNAMLLNEFLKEHRKVEKQADTIAELRSTVAQQRKDFQATIAKVEDSVTARLQEQAAQLQRVSAQLAAASPPSDGLETAKRAPEVAVNNP